jgi:hypothetical protein
MPEFLLRIKETKTPLEVFEADTKEKAIEKALNNLGYEITELDPDKNIDEATKEVLDRGYF